MQGETSEFGCCRAYVLECTIFTCSRRASAFLLVATKKTVLVHSSTVKMGGTCSQLELPRYDTTTTIAQTICRSTYGPRHLASIPTTTRTTISSVVTIHKPLQYSTECELIYITATLRYTDTVYVAITATVPPSVGASTSTRIAYVSSTTFEIVSETVIQTVTAPTTTITQGPYTVPAPADFTPIASNPSNAGANTFTTVQSSTSTQNDGQLTTSSSAATSDTAAVQSSTSTQHDGQLTTSSMHTASDTTTVQSSTTIQEEVQLTTSGTDPDVTTDTTLPDATEDTTPPGMRLLANVLHVRAEKSFSNVNRVICDETTTFVVTSVRPFTVRNTRLTSTATRQGVNAVEFPTATSFETTTETLVPYEDVTETVAITETETSLVYETTTVTLTYELTDLPRSTVYAACGADNIIGGIASYGIVQVAPKPMNRQDVSAIKVQASSAQSCCEACISQIERTCAGSVWWQNACYFILVSSQCSGSQEVIAFDASRGREFSAFEDVVMSNGACGQQVWSGLYCDRYDNNCVTDPAATHI
jgi:hypothetical protein